MDKFEVKGAKELERKLKRLSAAASGRVIRTAVNFAMTPALKDARANAPKGGVPHKTYKGRVVAPGFLSRSIKKKSKLARNKKTAWAWLQVDGEAFYGKFIEQGTIKLQAKPWMRPAMTRNKAIILSRYSDKMRQRIKIEAAK